MSAGRSQAQPIPNDNNTPRLDKKQFSQIDFSLRLLRGTTLRADSKLEYFALRNWRYNTWINVETPDAGRMKPGVCLTSTSLFRGIKTSGRQKRETLAPPIDEASKVGSAKLKIETNSPRTVPYQGNVYHKIPTRSLTFDLVQFHLHPFGGSNNSYNR